MAKDNGQSLYVAAYMTNGLVASSSPSSQRAYGAVAPTTSHTPKNAPEHRLMLVGFPSATDLEFQLKEHLGNPLVDHAPDDKKARDMIYEQSRPGSPIVYTLVVNSDASPANLPALGCAARTFGSDVVVFSSSPSHDLRETVELTHMRLVSDRSALLAALQYNPHSAREVA